MPEAKNKIVNEQFAQLLRKLRQTRKRQSEALADTEKQIAALEDLINSK